MSVSTCDVVEEQAVVDNLTSIADCNTSGNFATFSSSQALAWSALNGQWYPLSIPSPISLIGSCGNYAVISGNSAYAWNKTTNQWYGTYISSPKNLVGSGGNFAVFSEGLTWAWNAATSQWYGLGIPSPRALVGTGGNFAVISNSSGGLVYVWNKTNNQWIGNYVSSPSRLIGEGGNFAMLNDREAWAWNASTSQWYGLGISLPVTLAGSEGNFAVSSAQSGIGGLGLVYAWNKANNQWNGIYISNPIGKLIGDGGNFAVMSTGTSAQPVGQAWAWNALTNQWYGLNIWLPTQLAGSQGNFAAISSGFAHVWNKTTNQWTWTPVAPTTALVGSEGNFAAICDREVWAWNTSTNQWYGLSVSPSAFAGAGGNFAIISNSGGLAYVWNKTTNQWNGIYVSSPSRLIGEGSNFAVMTSVQPVGQAWAWNASTNQWYGLNIWLPTEMVGSQGNFAVISSGFAHAWNKATSQWSWISVSPTTALVGSGGNFAAVCDREEWTWNASTNQWYGLGIVSSGFAGAGGNVAIISSSSSLAYAWSKITNQWNGIYVPSPNRLLGPVDENSFWIDDSIIAQTTSSSVEFGFDGYGRYVIVGGIKNYALNRDGSISYKTNTTGNGRTQWLVFDFIGSNFFGSTSPLHGGAHMPIFLRSGTFQNSTRPYSAEGKGIFLGRNDVWGTCGAPFASGAVLPARSPVTPGVEPDDFRARIFFETKVVNPEAAVSTQGDQSAGAVECADINSDKYFEDNIKYQLRIHVNDTNIAYWIYRANGSGNMDLWSSNGIQSLDYPGVNFNTGFAAAKSTWLPNDHYRMNLNNIDTAFIVLTTLPTDNSGAWNIKMSNLGSGRF